MHKNTASQLANIMQSGDAVLYNTGNGELVACYSRVSDHHYSFLSTLLLTESILKEV